MAEYRFVTQWRLRMPVGSAWDVIVDSLAWPRWWRGVVSVEELRAGDENGVGGVRRYVWRSKLPYTLGFDMEVTRSEPPRLLEGRATGELEGRGLWELDEHDGVTTVRCTWEVRTTSAWMNLLAPVARPLFAWNHDWVMRRGGEGLAALLGVELVEA